MKALFAVQSFGVVHFFHIFAKFNFSFSIVLSWGKGLSTVSDLLIGSFPNFKR